MTRTLIAAASAATLAVAGMLPASAQSSAPARPVQRIEVTGQGSIDRAPDRVTLTFAIVTNDPAATRATSQNNVTYAALLAKMRAAGIASDAMRTVSYSFNFVPPNTQYAARTGYVVDREVSVSTDRTDQAGPIVDAAVSAGVTNVASVGFGLRDTRAAYRDALGAAVADAQAQAQALAAAAHMRVVRLIDLNAGATPLRPIGFTMSRAAVAAAPPPMPTDVQPSSLTVSANVTATYEIAP